MDFFRDKVVVFVFVRLSITSCYLARQILFLASFVFDLFLYLLVW